MTDYPYLKITAAGRAKLGVLEPDSSQPHGPDGFVDQADAHDPVARPAHYLQHPTGIECRKIVEAFTYHIATAMAYMWRCQFKHETPVEDLRKAIQHLLFEIERLEEEKP